LELAHGLHHQELQKLSILWLPVEVLEDQGLVAGGGAGGFLTGTGHPVTPGTPYTITVGGGGATISPMPPQGNQGSNGSNSFLIHSLQLVVEEEVLILSARGWHSNKWRFWWFWRFLCWRQRVRVIHLEVQEL
jgi:hypothetical protein